MKKLLSLMLALMLCFGLAACGGNESGSGSTDGGIVVTDDALKPLAEVYNSLAPVYNEVYEAAEANGWLEDEQTAAELQALGGTLSYVSTGLTEDSSILENADIDGLVTQLQGLLPAIESLKERVSVPYGE